LTNCLELHIILNNTKITTMKSIVNAKSFKRDGDSPAERSL